MINVVLYTKDRHTFSLIEAILKERRGNYGRCVWFDESQAFHNYLSDTSGRLTLYFLSMKMANQTGLDMAKEIRKYDKNSYIVLLNNSYNYGSEIFDVYVFDYLVEPINDGEQIRKILSRSIDYSGRDNVYFSFYSKRVEHSLKQSEIIYFEKNGRSVNLYTEKDSYTCNKTVKELLEQLSNQFIQIHGSYIVNRKFILAVNKDVCHLIKRSDSKNHGLKNIPISRSFKHNLAAIKSNTTFYD